MKKLGKIMLIILSVLVGIVVLAWGGLNIAKLFIYSDYYSAKDNVCKNPGLSDGFVCQGICELDGKGKILVSGYMKDKDASRIYVTNTDNNFITYHSPRTESHLPDTRVELLRTATKYTLHRARRYIFSLSMTFLMPSAATY